MSEGAAGAARVLVVGDVMRDIVVRLDGPIRRGTDQRATIDVLPGGAGANLAAWLAHCGVAVRLLACVGEGDLAAEEDRLRARGVEPALVGHAGLPTGRLIALVDPDGERSFLTDRGANDCLAVSALPPDLLAGVGHLHVSGYALVALPTRASTIHLMARARSAGLPVSVDPGSAGFAAEIGPGTMLGWMRDADLIVVNGDEAAVLTGSDQPDEQLAALTALIPLAVLKRGADGAVARHRDGRRWRVAAPAVAVADTIGAGDAFLAGFLSARLAGASIETSLARAATLGAKAVTIAGGAPA